MNNLKTIALSLVALVSFTVNAQTKKIDTKKSNIHWIGKKVTGQHDGTIALKAGALVFKGNKLAGGNFIVDMTTINTTDLDGGMKEKLDGHLKSDDFFGTEKFKTANLVFKTIADKVYAMTYAMHPPKQDEQEYEVKVPISLNGNKEDLDKVFKELEVTVDDKDIYSDWVLTSRQDSIIRYKNRSVNNHLVPNVKGMGLQDALYILENAGLKVNISGFGSVKKQSLRPGSNFRSGDKIYIELS